MADLKAMLEYQEVDRQLYKLELAIAESDERKKYVKLQKFLKVAPERLDALETKASALKAEAEAITKKYEQTESILADFETIDALLNEGGDVTFLKKKAQSTLENVRKLKVELNNLITGIKEIDEEYRKMKKQVISAQNQYEEAKNDYNQVKASKEDERVAILAQLKKLSANISENLFHQYQTKRKEKLFPIVGQLNQGRCPFCSMEPPIIAKSKLADGIECDNCHRIIFE